MNTNINQETDEINEPIEIKVIVTKVTPKDTSKPSFNKYKIVRDGGRLVELRFKRDVNTSEIDKCTKCVLLVDTLQDASANFEYPRFYAGGLISVEKIY